MYIPSGEFCDLIESTSVTKYAPRCLIIKHLKGLRTDNLKPMHEGLDACVGIQMGIGNNFLLESNVLGCPTEEDGAGDVDHSDKYWWVYLLANDENRDTDNGLPHDCRG